MVREISASTKAVGFWSAVLATLFSVTYVVAQIAEWLGLLGSQGGPESSRALGRDLSWVDLVAGSSLSAGTHGVGIPSGIVALLMVLYLSS